MQGYVWLKSLRTLSVNSVELCARPTQLECLLSPSIHVGFVFTWAPAESVVDLSGEDSHGGTGLRPSMGAYDRKAIVSSANYWALVWILKETARQNNLRSSFLYGAAVDGE